MCQSLTLEDWLLEALPLCRLSCAKIANVAIAKLDRCPALFAVSLILPAGTVQGYSARFPPQGQHNIPLLNVVGVGIPGCKLSINFTPNIPVQSVRHQLNTGCQLWLYEQTSFFAGANVPITCSGSVVYYRTDTRVNVWNTDN